MSMNLVSRCIWEGREMSVLQVDSTTRALRAVAVAPYCRGDRIRAVSPEGVSYTVRVERVVPTATGEFNVIGAVTSPRRFRSHLLTTVVGADGFGPAIRRVG
jgi:hypothetical protein